MTDDLLLADGTVIPAETRTRCEVYSRVVGYLRPVTQWNLGKKAEFADRIVFDGSAKRDLRTTKREVHEN